MAHTDARSQRLDQGAIFWSITLPLSLGFLPYPYSMFAGIIGFFLLCLWQTYFYPRQLFKLLYRNGFLAIALLMVVGARLANFPGEAYLQLTHFLPFFWFWGVLVLYLRQTANPWPQIYHWALAVVTATVPLNIIGIVEYALKRIPLVESSTYLPWIDWLYLGDVNNPRTFSLFDDPNTLASFLVMVLGLNIGLVFLRPKDSETLGRLPTAYRYALAVNILLTLVCLFCSGSRNGYLSASLVLLVSFFVMRTSRWVRSLGLLGIALIVVSTLKFGIGGRTLSWAWVTDDPRVWVWKLALQMIRDRPLWGQGLGNYKLLYNGEVPGYDYIAHAHNFWLMLASEAGLPVIILFTITVSFICYRGCRALFKLQKQPNAYALLMGYYLCFLGITLFSLFDITLFEARVNLLAWLSLGVIYSGPELSRLLRS
ncbi:O-antigen ligase family protein [Oscillatoria sp. CS-180]|uniref:O-antigen ligase family protein n=1 Tax=Oscillatoria sp. CS-180 TaxID=3021720 RepID=UPI00232CCFA5|nr:O-antigen ligase family protein [Oscillatoria sp. CS-180]MDB9525798.1 O-antigen ligase family protein [Oscillatoria sp. CS-180]